jgi:tight adherence protein C
MKEKEKKEPLYFLYPVCLIIYEIVKRLPIWKDDEVEKKLSELHMVSKERLQKQVVLFRCRQIAYVLVVMAGTLLVWLCLMARDKVSSENPSIMIKRNDYGQTPSKEQLFVSIEGQEAEKVEVEVEARQYTEKELEEKFREAFDYVEEQIKGENESLEAVWKPLYLPEEVPNSPMEIRWTSNRYDLIRSNGTVMTDTVTEPTIVTLTGIFTLQGIEKENVYSVCVVEPRLTQQEAEVVQVVKEIQQQEKNSRSEESFPVSGKIGNAVVSGEQKEEQNYGVIIIIGLIISALLFARQREELNEQAKEREQKLELEYPELVRQLGLLIGSGTTMKGAFWKLGDKYRRVKEKGGLQQPVYEEILILNRQMEQGISPVQALEQWGTRIGLTSYRKLANVLIQNVSRGNAGLVPLLEQEELSAMEHRRQLAKQVGEEASTKLLMPMVALLVVTIALIMVPALIQFQF